MCDQDGAISHQGAGLLSNSNHLPPLPPLATTTIYHTMPFNVREQDKTHQPARPCSPAPVAEGGRVFQLAPDLTSPDWPFPFGFHISQSLPPLRSNSGIVRPPPSLTLALLGKKPAMYFNTSSRQTGLWRKDPSLLLYFTVQPCLVVCSLQIST